MTRTLKATNLGTLAEGVARRAARLSDRAIFGLASRREERLDEKVSTLSRSLEWFRDELITRAKQAKPDDVNCSLLDFAIRDAHGRLTMLGSQLRRGTGAERNAMRAITAALQRAATDFASSADEEEVAEAVVAAVDDVYDYLYSHDLARRAPRLAVVRATRIRRRVKRSSVATWERGRAITEREPELVVKVTSGLRGVIDDQLLIA